MAKKEKSTKDAGLWPIKNQRIMLSLIIVGIIICAFIFTTLGVMIANRSNQTIDTIGKLYAKNMGNQIAAKFEAVMNQRFRMVDALVAENGDVEGDLDKMSASAKSRDFEFLAFYAVDEVTADKDNRQIKMLLGQDVTITDPVPFRTSVKNGEYKMAVGSGINANGQSVDNIVVISVPTTKFTLNRETGQKCQALIAGLSNKDFVDMLDLNKDTSDEEILLVKTAIVRNNASFVMERPDNEPYKNEGYFKFLRDNYGATTSNIEEIIQNLSAAMHDKNRDYSTILHIADEAGRTRHVHLYCRQLANSEWQLISIMDNQTLDGEISALSEKWTVMIIISIVTMIVVLTGIFLIYWYYNQQNIAQLQEMREIAINANKTKSEFLSNMSHDIRTPMNAIVGMTAIAMAHSNDKKQVDDCLKKIALSSKHLLGLINDVLDMSKIESGKMTLNVEQVSLREVLDEITTIVQPQLKIKHQHFNVNVQSILQENVYCDSVRLNQVLLNLLSNAIKFTGDEGTIEICLNQEPSPVGEDYVRTRISVKDNGIGMSEEYQKKIFESFSREDNKRVHHTEGSGLGMAIVKYIVDTMGGTIEVDSKQGIGTKFTITIDFEKATVPEEEMILPNWKMLLVDDDKQLCETTTVALKEIGVESDWTLDGESAVEMTVDAHKARKPYDIILLDWKLPSIDGIETARRIRKRLGDDNTPILLISAYDWSDIEEEAREAGICGFISKPLFKSTLYYGLKNFAPEQNLNETNSNSRKQVDSLEGIHILLAEDNELNWEIAETLLDGVGISCDHAENGKICVDMLTNSKPGTYQAILMDIRMPVMTGYEATKLIRESDHPDKDLPIIAMTADAFVDDMKKCLDCGMNAHIAKPIDMDIVQKTLAKFIKKQ